jgi:PAT family beta-lactamase induction signal transducer AmpG
MYAILMAITNVGQGAGMAVSGLLSDQVGFRWTFGLFAALNLVALPLLTPLFRSEQD